MKIYKISKLPLVWIMSLDSFVEQMDSIKQSGSSVVSIRDHLMGRNEEKYKLIDAQSFERIFVATFDDLETNTEKRNMPTSFPKENDIHEILAWAKMVWEDSGKNFVIHCTAGISRSSAMAILISQMIEGSYEGVIDPNIHSPNYRVLEYGETYLGTDHVQNDVRNTITEFDKKVSEDDMF